MQTSHSLHSTSCLCRRLSSFSSATNSEILISSRKHTHTHPVSSLSLSLSLSGFSSKPLSLFFFFFPSDQTSVVPILYSYFILTPPNLSSTIATSTVLLCCCFDYNHHDQHQEYNSNSSRVVVRASEMPSSMGTLSHEEEEEDPTDPNNQNQIPLASHSHLPSGPSNQNTRQLLIRCAELVSLSDWTAAQRLVSIISSNASPYGDSTERLVHQFARALSFRLNRRPLSHNLLMLPTTATTTAASISVTTATPTPHHHHQTRTGGSGDFWVHGCAGGDGGGGGVAQDLDMELEFNWEAVESSYLYLNQITPFIRFSHLTANQAILEATEGQECIHILDFDTMQGLQWPPLMQAIAERHRRSFSSTSTSSREEEPSSNPSTMAPTPTPMIRITGTGQDLSILRRTGDRLQKFAHSLGLRFHFRPLLIEGPTSSSYYSPSSSWVAAMAAHLPSAVPLMPNEALAVNCVHFLNRLLRDDNDNDATRLILRAIKALNPRVVTVAEREASHNQPFLKRFVQALDHYTAIFDSLEATLPPNSRERLTVEQVWFGREILDVVATDGDQRRQRHERFETWVELLTSSGFSSLPLSPYALSQAKLLLRLHYPSEGYQLQILNGSFFLGWQHQPLFSVSSWH
ncbi:scarecrow-like protein 18 [Macadamia integrifolia]|uniref:scarecrow-like protein 18 n=1 Tax=Macadamia integrifolia TaxID=60698 RepID=UPI001C531B8B|nr:scarecrow-like protein 18 [Macadamia integrifolia]